MATELDTLLVIDVESTCWMGKPPKDMKTDIIEIGVVEVDVLRQKVIGAESILVVPTTSEVGWFCKKLTTLTDKHVRENGIPFRDACRILMEKYRTKLRPWASWGDYDRNQFKRQCEREKIKYPFGGTHINAKDLFSLVHKLDREFSMVDALTHLQLSLTGIHHRGVDDAQNIAELLVRTLWRSLGE
jgi:inhibitor of KinA sporulation pathway (predicted exonuclease)